MMIQQKLVDLLQRAHEEEQRFVASVTEDERSAVGTREDWSVKDVFAHMAEWKLRAGQRLAAARRGEVPPVYDGEIDDLNAEIFEQYRDQSWADVVGALECANGELVKHAEAMSEENLIDPDRFAWQEGRPLWRNIASNGCIHTVLHLVELYLERGDAADAIEMQENMTPLLASLDDSPEWQAITTYNTACVYALAGDKEKAIAKLGEALELNSGITEWSKQDPDLASIREEPGYRVLYGS